MDDIEAAVRTILIRQFYEPNTDERKLIYEYAAQFGLNRVVLSRVLAEKQRNPRYVVTERRLNENDYPART